MQFIHHLPLFGSFANALMIIAGGILGLLIKKKVPTRLLNLPVMALELYVLVLGISFALKSQHPLIMVTSLAVGSLIGEIIDLDGHLQNLGKTVEIRLGPTANGFAKGFVTCSLLFCTGSMAVLGAFQEGFGEFPVTLLTKGMIDGITGIAFAATLGFGVIFSSIPVFIYQGTLAICATWLRPLMTETAINEMTAVGGIMLIAIAFSMAELKRFRAMNMLPGFVVAVFLVWLNSIM